MSPPPPFNVLKAAFVLLAILVCTAMFGAVASITFCTIGAFTGRFEPGTCVKLGLTEFYQQAWADALAAILALLAVRPPPPPPPPEQDDNEHK